MKLLRNIYNQMGLVFIIIAIVLLYKGIIALNWTTGAILVVIVAVIFYLGKVIPAKK